jgi:hypothetical protein
MNFIYLLFCQALISHLWLSLLLKEKQREEDPLRNHLSDLSVWTPLLMSERKHWRKMLTMCSMKSAFSQAQI